MVSIKSQDLLDLKRVGAGNFGTIYQCGDVVYKIYHPMVKTEYDSLYPNPSLKFDKTKIKRYMKLDKKLQYTDLIQDIIFVDGKFGGIVLPYYDGETLFKTLDQPVEQKIEIAYQIVRNSRELTDNSIYPFDYKLNNIMLVNGSVKFIDLDDAFTFLTSIPSPRKTKKVVKAVDETIKTYFNDINTYPFSKQTVNSLARDRKPNTSYKEIEQYIADKSRRINYLFIDSNSDDVLDNITLIRNPNFRKIYVYSGSDTELSEMKINQLLGIGINIYDTVSASMMRKYIRSIAYDECIGIVDNKILNLKR